MVDPQDMVSDNDGTSHDGLSSSSRVLNPASECPKISGFKECHHSIEVYSLRVELEQERSANQLLR